MGFELGVLVYERSAYWGPELKRQLADQSAYVHECRSVQDLVPAAISYRRAVAVLVLDSDPGECLSWMTGQFQTAANLPVVIVASPELSELEWVLREAGAASFVDDEVPGHRLARLVLRLLKAEKTVV